MSKRNVQIKIMVSPEENEIIRKNAKACDKIPSAYIREMAMNMYILECDYKAIEEHTKQISAIRNALTHLIFTIRKTDSYVPADLEWILEKMNAIFKLERRFLQNDSQFRDEIEAKLKKTVQTIVNEHLSKNATDSSKK